MNITKSQIVLNITENLLDQEDQAILESIYRQTGLVLEDLTDDELEAIMEAGGYTLPIPGVKTAVDAVSPHLAKAGGWIAKGAEHVQHFAGTNPVAAGAIGAGALALGAAAALRRHAKTKALKRAAGM